MVVWSPAVEQPGSPAQRTDGDDGGGQGRCASTQLRRRSVQRRSLPKSLSQELVRSTGHRLPTWIGAGVPRAVISPR